jgi:hypothetical protein
MLVVPLGIEDGVELHDVVLTGVFAHVRFLT